MFKILSALYAPEGDADSGAGGGGSQQDGDQGSKDDKDLVPASRLKAALENQARTLRAEFAAELDAKLKAVAEKPPAKDEPKRYTRAELNAAVKDGQITQEQADAEMDRQLREDAEASARRVASETVSAAQRKERIDSEIARYKAVAPEILEDGHETREKIRSEYQALVDLGDDPKAVATQLKAIRAVLGPIDNLEKAKSGRHGHDNHRETGGDGGGGSRKSFKDNLSPQQRKFYEKGIDQGRYKDWAAVEEELKYAKRRTA